MVVQYVVALCVFIVILVLCTVNKPNLYYRIVLVLVLVFDDDWSALHYFRLCLNTNIHLGEHIEIGSILFNVY